jgi:RecA-family ATPase
MLPRRRWLLGRSLLRGNVSVKVAPPGVGKSTLGIQQAVAVVTGEEITGQQVHERAKVWIYNNEDDPDELRRRLAAILQHWGIPFNQIKGHLALNSGADRTLILAGTDRLGNVIRFPDVDACIAEIRDQGIGVFIVDPFIETHEVNENSNEQIKAVAAMFREIARRGDCAVLLVHHTAKPPLAASDGHAGNMNAARGASALTGVARIVQTLFSMSARDAEHYGIKEEDRHLADHQQGALVQASGRYDRQWRRGRRAGAGGPGSPRG